MLLNHADIWQAIDDLARDHGFTVSGLARRSGLDPTTFNKSKRVSIEGRQRWPSLESISKILETTGTTPLDFFGYSASTGPEKRPAKTARLPVMAMRRAGEREPFDAQGHPKGKLWDERPFPDLPERYAYGLIVNGDSGEPYYRDGDLVVLGPHHPLRRGDRAVVRSITGRMRICEFVRRMHNKLEVRSFGGEKRVYGSREIAFAHRIILATQ